MPDPTRRAAGLLLAAVLLAPAAAAWSQGAPRSAITEADIAALKPGQFIWAPNLAPEGPMVMVVSLAAQQAYVYRNGVRIGVSTVSTGKKGKETPTGVFTILQKNAKHRSNLYNDAPMPYMQRLTWDGIALHAGNLPGYPASHGCVRLPMAFAQSLFKATAMGMTVVVTRDAPKPARLDGGDLLAPVTTAGAAHPAAAAQRLADDESFRWEPKLAPTGPVTIIVSSHDQRMLVLRNGKLIGRGRIDIPPGRVSGDTALQFTGFDAQQRTQWTYVSVPGQEQLKGKALDFSGAKDLEISPDYLKLVRGVLKPGATLLITDGAILAGGASKDMTVIDSEGA
jgi:hypothetical protein